MSRPRAHAGDRLVMTLGTVVAVLCAVACYGLALFGGAA